MTPATATHSLRNPAPFLPANFAYEAPQYASLMPTSAITLDVEADNIPCSRKTLRTVSTLFNDEGRLAGAKINLSTGEVVAHDYKDYFERGPKARRNPNAPDCPPFWMHMAPGTRSSVQITQKDTSTTNRFNAVKMYLDGYLDLSDAAEDLPLLQNIIESINLLDLGGSTRPLNSGLLFSMLQHLDFITPKTVMEYMGCGRRHAQKVALCLRVIVNAFEKTTEGKLSTAPIKTPPNKSRAEARQ